MLIPCAHAMPTAMDESPAKRGVLETPSFSRSKLYIYRGFMSRVFYVKCAKRVIFRYLPGYVHLVKYILSKRQFPLFSFFYTYYNVCTKSSMCMPKLLSFRTSQTRLKNDHFHVKNLFREKKT